MKTGMDRISRIIEMDIILTILSILVKSLNSNFIAI